MKFYSAILCLALLSVVAAGLNACSAGDKPTPTLIPPTPVTKVETVSTPTPLATQPTATLMPIQTAKQTAIPPTLTPSPEPSTGTPEPPTATSTVTQIPAYANTNGNAPANAVSNTICDTNCDTDFRSDSHADSNRHPNHHAHAHADRSRRPHRIGTSRSPRIRLKTHQRCPNRSRPKRSYPRRQNSRPIPRRRHACKLLLGSLGFRRF